MNVTSTHSPLSLLKTPSTHKTLCLSRTSVIVVIGKQLQILENDVGGRLLFLIGRLCWGHAFRCVKGGETWRSATHSCCM